MFNCLFIKVCDVISTQTVERLICSSKTSYLGHTVFRISHKVPFPSETSHFQAQREKFIELRINDPNLRIRDYAVLGPKKTVNVKMSRTSGLEAPEEFFVELDIYTTENPDKEVKPEDVVWEETEPGVWKQGVT